jgi:hypothetical protein
VEQRIYGYLPNAASGFFNLPDAVTEALKTSNIKTVLFILRTIDKEEGGS